MLLWSGSAGESLGESPSVDDRLVAAKAFVESSERYLHQDHLRRGMIGYGLTVMSGTKVVRFELEIISVMKRFGPHQDVILCRLSGQGLEKTGLISGMSGSPCYVRHEGQDKLIGAVAYGWMAPKEALCGIQPITQMLAVAGTPQPEKSMGPTSQGITVPGRGSTALIPKRRKSEQSHGPQLSPGFIAAVLDPAKRDFSYLVLPAPQTALAGDGGPRLAPLLMPLSVSGIGRGGLDRLGKILRPMGMIPVAAGGVGGEESHNLESVELTPGGAISVPLVTGDADFSAIGTVTDVVNGRVLAFGHGFFGDGQTAWPMGPGYIHMVFPGVVSSFKLGSSLRITGTLDRDEMVGVAGRIGTAPEMIPMTVEVRWEGEEGEEGYTQNYSYEVVKHRWLTPVLGSVLTAEGVWGWRKLPELHTVRYSVEIDFGELGRYEVSNVTSGLNILGVRSDLVRPLTAMLNNPFDQVPAIKRIAVKMQIEHGTKKASIVALKLNGMTYRPGETITGKVTIRPFRKPRKELPVSFVLPEDIPDGVYKLTACDYMRAISSLRSEMPHKFAPKTIEQLFESIRLVVRPRADRLYLRVPLKRGGLAFGPKELPDLPESKMAILKQAGKIDTYSFKRAIVQTLESPYVLEGSTTAEFKVQTRVTEILIHQQRNDK